MKSGLEDRNNPPVDIIAGGTPCVSMKSGLEDRNNRRNIYLDFKLDKLSQ